MRLSSGEWVGKHKFQGTKTGNRKLQRKATAYSRLDLAAQSRPLHAMAVPHPFALSGALRN
jgi:hypothetical protein